MRRLYVGGLSHTVTEKDLKDRFGKFGAVEDVELRTRKDPEGVPFKTFGYVNINISDADLKKCLTVLNKSKWKGGTLQIEIAKESFLHRLAQERQESVEQHLQQPAAEDKRQKLLDSLSKAGVDNFTMKAAVPGTEIPGHKDWVVSKFGRVLPILQLRSQKGSKSRNLKYDPSKYSHNIRKLDRNTIPDEATPVTQLTWEVQGGDDEISKKRRGEFPPCEPWRPKKSRTDNVSGRTRFEHPVNSVNRTEGHQLTNGFEKQNNHRLAQKKWTHFTDNDADSEEEIRRLVAAQQTSHVTPQQQEVEEDNLEVVGYDFLAKSACIGDQDKDDYDSADTDELFASRKPPPAKCQEKHTPPTAEHLSGNNTDKKRKTKKKRKAGEQEEEDGSTDDEEHLTSRKPSCVQQKRDSSEQKLNKKTRDLPVVRPSSSESDRDEEDEGDEVDSVDSCSDSDYEAMFSNITHLEISLADLQRLAEAAQQNSKTVAPSFLGAGLEQETLFPSFPAEQPAPKKGSTPEEILAMIMEDDSSEDEQKKKKRKRQAVTSAPLPAFQGTKALNEVSEDEEEDDGRGREVKKQKMNADSTQLVHKETDSKTITSVRDQNHAETKISDSSEQEEDDDEEEEEEDESDDEKAETESSSSSKASPSSCSSSGKDKNEPQVISAKGGVKAALNRETSTSEEEEEEELALPRMALGVEEEEERQRQANMRRLAAVQQRQKEAEEHKKLIQGALANLDAPVAGAGKHIVFGSDDEEDDGNDDGDQQRMDSEVLASRKTLFQDGQSEDEATGDEATANKSVKVKAEMRLKSSGPQLFGGSDDEDEEDGSRFDIKPQFEGQAGQKLMALQSRFGTDDRFRMDSRFLEEDEEVKEEDAETKKTLVEDDEDLEEEKKKTLSILQSVLGQQHCSSKTAGKAKKFKDVSALHYDPSKEEHAAFETKKEEVKKESKAARKKKREEAQKLPEVSKEIYYDVSGDLKTVFGQSKDETDQQEEKMNWDQKEEEEERKEKEEESAPLLSVPSVEKEDLCGFKFSFFGDDTETGSKETADYKVEAIQAPKVSWHQDPRFHDSSSEEEEDEQEEDEEQGNTTAKTTEVVMPSHTEFFFFYPDDDRLTDGPKSFWRVSELEEQREQWEERRSALRQEYRKKHKDARRKLTSSLKS
uniref:nucleolar protein 8 n=1 Tax=Maylandia zebra TaxID=106582 RepID=UPI000647AF51|nr:nucleolar protein 8 [Maylandia zebra]